MSDDFTSSSYGALLAVYGDVEDVERVITRIRNAETTVLRLVEGLTAEGPGPVHVIAEFDELRFYGNGSVRTLVSGLRSTLQRGELRLLLSWDVVRTMAPVVSEASVPADSTPPYRRCWRLIQHALGGPAFASYLLDNLDPWATNAAIVMSQQLRATYTSLLANPHFPWSGLPRSSISEFQLLRVAPRYFPADATTLRQLDAMYGAYPLARGYPSFFETWLETCDLAARTQRNVSELVLSALETPNAMYFKDKVVVTGSLLLTPLFAFDSLVAANYAGLGHVVAHEILRKLHLKLTQAGNESIAAWSQYGERVRCLQQSRMAGGSSVVGSESGGDVNRTITLADVADLVGLHAAYVAFGASKENLRLPSAHMTEEQVFFVMSCFKFCKNSAAGDGHRPPSLESQIMGAMAPPSPPRERCNAPLRHLEAFVDAFKCSNSSRMNAALKCTFW
ncbi:endothelin-converting enzyme 2-like [Haemaphysalis longicornis]